MQISHFENTILHCYYWLLVVIQYYYQTVAIARPKVVP